MTANPAFHFFTLVTKGDQYDAMRASLGEAGFDESNSIFTVLDNRERNAYEAYSALTDAVRTAQAPYVVFCHQDLIFQDGPDALLAAIGRVEERDPQWAVLGNTGYRPGLRIAAYLDDPGGSHQTAVLPAKVLSLDENLLIVRRDSQIGCSPELSGFHLYAADLCLNAYLKGFSAWVIDFRVTHLTGALDYSGLRKLASRFREVWRKRLGSVVLVTPSAVLVFSRVPFLFDLLNRDRMYERFLYRYRWLPTLDFLLRHGRPVWLPMARFQAGDLRGPYASGPIRAVDLILRRGRPMWSPNREYEEVEPTLDADALARW